MKYFMLFCQGLADDPVEELGLRTPLEAAKTPWMDLLVKKGKIGSASFVPRQLSATGDVACLAILGFDPLESYTGLGPLEALSMNIPLSDNEVAFRCDLVTALDEVLVDPLAGGISPRESRFLIDELNAKLGTPKVRFHSQDGYKNVLVIKDPEAVEELDGLECVPPGVLLRERVDKHLPRGKGHGVLTDLMNRSKKILESHEINRVRVDLKENPANMIWPWGQGRKPKLAGFEQRHGVAGAVVSESSFVQGLARALGMKLFKNFYAAEEADFVFVYTPSDPSARGLKSKIRQIEDFDLNVVGPAFKEAERLPEYRICVGTDCVESLAKNRPLHGRVPFLIEGDGVQADEVVSFSERAAETSRLRFDKGQKLINFFLKP